MPLPAVDGEVGDDLDVLSDPDLGLVDVEEIVPVVEEDTYWVVRLNGDEVERSNPVRELVRLLRLGHREAADIWDERSRPGISDEDLAVMLEKRVRIDIDQARAMIQGWEFNQDIIDRGLDARR